MPDGLSSKPSWPNWLPVLALIALALLLRLPRMEEMEAAPDWLTSHTVLVTRIWHMTGLAANHYSLVSNWPNPPDRHAEYGPGTVFDAEGNSYFLSFPPLAFYVAHAVFTILGLGPSLLPLRLSMLCACSLGALALAGAVRHVWGLGEGSVAAPSIAAAVFLYSPVCLYYFGFSYFPLILSVPLWMGLIALFFRATPAPGLIGAATFLLCYTDWLGFLAIAPMSILCVRRRDWRLLGAMIAPAAMALGLTLATYASVAGWQALIAALQTRYLIRSAANEAGWLLAIARNYYLGFAPLTLPLAAACLAAPGRRRRIPAQAWPLLFCLTLPVVLDHVLLINHTAHHRYAALKAAPGIGVAMAMLFAALPALNRRVIGAGLAAAALAWAAAAYYRTPFRANPELPAIANLVQYRVGLDRMLFLQRDRHIQNAEPALILLTERNFHVVDSVEEARTTLAKWGHVKGFYVRMVSYRPPRAAGSLIDVSKP